MRKRTTPKTRPSSISAREIGPLPWSYVFVIAICGCILAAGFFLAARQHFMSMEIGMKNSKLRKQLEDLESENRRLLLAREVSLSPAEITKTARNLGFREVITGSDLAPTLAAVKTPLHTGPAERPSFAVAITMTASQRPVKNDEPKRTAAKAEHAKQKTIKPELMAIAKR